MPRIEGKLITDFRGRISGVIAVTLQLAFSWSRRSPGREKSVARSVRRKIRRRVLSRRLRQRGGGAGGEGGETGTRGTAIRTNIKHRRIMHNARDIARAGCSSEYKCLSRWRNATSFRASSFERAAALHSLLLLLSPLPLRRRRYSPLALSLSPSPRRDL